MQHEDDSQRAQERLLVLRAQQGDSDAFRRLVDLYDRRLLYYVLRFVDDPERALDILQDVWLDTYLRLPRLKAAAAFRVWLYRIARAKIVDFLRSKRRATEMLDAVQARARSDVESDDVELESAELVHRTLPELSLAHRDVLTLRFLEDMSLEEIAGVLGCQLGTVKSRLHYAKLAFREAAQRILG